MNKLEKLAITGGLASAFAVCSLLLLYSYEMDNVKDKERKTVQKEGIKRKAEIESSITPKSRKKIDCGVNSSFFDSILADKISSGDKFGKFLNLSAQEFLTFTDHNGKRLFSCKDAIDLDKLDATIENVELFTEFRYGNQVGTFDGDLIVQYLYLGLTPDKLFSFQDTDKLNAVMIFPSYDPIHGFRNGCSKSLMERIMTVYDTKVIVASYEDDVHKVLMDTPDINLVVLGGHGSRTDIRLGGGDFYPDEEQNIDVSDSEMGSYLNLLAKNAIIFFDSCSVGEGGSEGINLINYLASIARKDITFIGSQTPFSCGGISVKSLYPFNAEIKGFTNNNPTYITNGKL